METVSGVAQQEDARERGRHGAAALSQGPLREEGRREEDERAILFTYTHSHQGSHYLWAWLPGVTWLSS